MFLYQPEHSISYKKTPVFAARLKMLWILDYPQSALHKLRLDCAYVQADLSFR